MKEEQKVTLRKVPIIILLDALKQLYSMGVDFVDIIGENDVEQDKVELRYNVEYMAIEEEEEDKKQEDVSFSLLKLMEEEDDDDDSLSDDYLNQLTDNE